MTITTIKFMFLLGIIGHAINMYCDRILSIFPNGRIMLGNIKEVQKDGVLAHLLDGVSADVPMRSAVWGVFAIVLEFLSYFALSIYTYDHSHILGGIMFLSSTFFCIVASGFHVKTALCEYVFLKMDRDERGKELLLDFLNTAPVLRLCAVGLIVYVICLIIAVITGVIGFPIWAVLFTILPVAIVIFPFKIIGTLHIAAMVSMFAWIFLV